MSRFFDRISRPEQLIPSLMNAMRVLTDPADTGAVTVCLPQDVQAEAHDWPLAFFAKRVWHIGRPVPEPAALDRALAVIRSAKRPLVVAGGGVVYAEASEELRAFATATGIPVSDTHAGKGAINWDHPSAVGGVGSTGSSAANALAREADVVIGIGTRYSDFTTASHTVFANEDVRFVNVNVLGFDAAKHGATMLVADAREALRALTAGLEGWQVDDAYRQEAVDLDAAWQQVVDECYHRDHTPLPAQTEVFGALNELMGPQGRRHQRRRLDAGRPAVPVAGLDPGAVPRRVRVLVHGLRDPGVARREAGRRRRAARSWRSSVTAPTRCCRWRSRRSSPRASR